MPPPATMVTGVPVAGLSRHRTMSRAARLTAASGAGRRNSIDCGRSSLTLITAASDTRLALGYHVIGYGVVDDGASNVLSPSAYWPGGNPGNFHRPLPSVNASVV